MTYLPVRKDLISAEVRHLTKRVSRDEVIGVWLRREFEGNWHRIKNLVSSYVPNLTKQTIKKIVDNPNYQDDKENNLRYMLLYSFRAPTLLAVWNASWFGKKISENEFKELMVINFHDWNVLSDLTGKLSYVAERVYKEPRIHTASNEGALNEYRSINRRLFSLSSW